MRTNAKGIATIKLAFDQQTIRRRFTITARGTTRTAWFFTNTPITIRAHRHNA